MYADARDYWKDFARDARRMGSQLYADLALAIDGDADLKAMTEGHRKGQPAANLLLAAVHFLLMRGAAHPLRDFYPTLGGTRTGAADLFVQFRDFAFTHREPIVRLVQSRVTNTNEVGRSSVLRAGFAALAQEERAPLHLIEIGPSAGLNMIWDHYGARYLRDGVVAAEALPESKLVLNCELKGGAIPKLSPLPSIVRRVGLELNPVDLAHPDDRDWLRALVWPDQPERLARLETAIGMFLETPTEIRAGDALALLPAALAEVPPQDAVCIYHTIVLYQFSAEMLTRLTAILAEAGRPVWQLGFEFDRVQDYAVNLTHHGRGESRKLAMAQPHGGWMAWEA